jgi:hypothetical protein
MYLRGGDGMEGRRFDTLKKLAKKSGMGVYLSPEKDKIIWKKKIRGRTKIIRVRPTR